MKAVVQRVKNSEVRVSNKIVGKIGKGLLVFLGVTHSDSEKDINWLVNKIKDLRIFQDEQDKMNLSLMDTGGEILIVSQFTLYANAVKGRRPSFVDAAKPDMANELYEKFIDEFKKCGIKVQTGEFGTDMQVSLVNDGPVTIILDTDNLNI